MEESKVENRGGLFKASGSCPYQDVYKASGSSPYQDLYKKSGSSLY